MKLSKQTIKDLKEIRQEMKKANPDEDKIFELMCGKKYKLKIYNNEKRIQLQAGK